MCDVFHIYLNKNHLTKLEIFHGFGCSLGVNASECHRSTIKRPISEILRVNKLDILSFSSVGRQEFWNFIFISSASHVYQNSISRQQVSKVITSLNDGFFNWSQWNREARYCLDQGEPRLSKWHWTLVKTVDHSSHDPAIQDQQESAQILRVFKEKNIKCHEMEAETFVARLTSWTTH